MQLNKKALSLTEVLVATFIWALILGFIFVFLGDVIDQISKSKKEVKVISNYLDLSNKINDYRDIYSTWTIIIDNSSWTWSDIFIMKTPDSSAWVLFWIVSLDNYKINTNTSTYKASSFGFRSLSFQEISSIESDEDFIYWLLFQKDKVYSELNVQDLQIKKYNSWDLHEIEFLINIDYHSSMKWSLWINLSKDSLIKFNLDF